MGFRLNVENLEKLQYTWKTWKIYGILRQLTKIPENGIKTYLETRVGGLIQKNFKSCLKILKNT